MHQELPATVLQHETIYEGRVFAIARDRVRMPNGHESAMEVVHHRGSVVLLPMPDPNHVILVRQYRYPVDRWLWELAAGCLEPGEDPAAAAARECEEEIGLFAGRVEQVGRFFPSPGYCDELMNFFLVTGLRAPGPGEQPAPPDADEDIRTRAFSLDEVRAMVLRGEIVDLKTAAGITLI